jgi:ribonuclease HI
LKLKHNQTQFSIEIPICFSSESYIKEIKQSICKALKEAKKQLKKMVKKFNSEKISKLIEKARTNYQKAPKVFFQSLNVEKKQNKNSLIAVIDSDKNTVTQPNEVKQIIQNFYSQLFISKEENTSTIEALKEKICRSQLELNIMEKIMDRITGENIATVIEKLPKNKATPDCIPYELFKWAPKQLSEHLAHLFNKILQEKDIPDHWRNSTIIPIHKGGSALDVKNYRPIALAPSMYKIFMTIIQQRIQQVLDKLNILHHGQNGFKPNTSTQINIFQYLNILQNAKSLDRPLYVAYIDIKKAYDSVEHWGINQVLKYYNFPNSLIQLLTKVYQKNNTKIASPHGDTDNIHMNKGVKQGCPLSPTIFNIFLNPLLEHIEQTTTGYRLQAQTVRVLAYCDDLILISETEQDLQSMLNKVTNYFTHFNLDIGLDTNRTKTCVSTNREFVNTPRLNNSNLPILKKNESYKYLGIHINLDMNWYKQETILRAQLIKHLTYLKNRCIPSAQITTIINQVIIPTTAYRMSCVNLTNEFKNSYNSILNRFVYNLMHLKGYNSITHIATNVDTFGFNIKTMQQTQAICMARTFIKQIIKHTNPRLIKQITYDIKNKTNHTNTILKILEEYNIKITPTNYDHYHSTAPYNEEHKTRENIQSNKTSNFIALDMGVNRHQTESKGWLNIYTDGSQKNNTLTSACIIKGHNIDKSLVATYMKLQSMSNYTAESMAILTALREVSINTSIKIYTDSLSVIQAIQSAQKGKTKITDHILSEILYILQVREEQGTTTTLNHVYSHLLDKSYKNSKKSESMKTKYGNEWEELAQGNKEADELAAIITTPIYLSSINEFFPKFSTFVNDKLVPFNPEDTAVKTIYETNAKEYRELYGTKELNNITAKYASRTMKDKHYKAQPKQHFLFKLHKNKLSTNKRTYELNTNININQTKVNQNRGPKCPLGCNTHEDIPHVLACLRNPLSSSSHRKRIKDIVNKYRHKIRKPPLKWVPAIWDLSKNSRLPRGKNISINTKRGLYYGMIDPEIKLFGWIAGIKGKYRADMIYEITNECTDYFLEKWRKRCKQTFS